MTKIKSLAGQVLATGASVKEILKAHVATTIRGPQRTSFRNADLRMQDLQGAEITASNNPRSQRRSDFMGASFAGSNLMGAKFSGLDLRAADFSDCDLRGAVFVTCDLDGACFDRVSMHAHTDDERCGHRPYIAGCTIRHMHARDADFTGMTFIILDRDFSVPYMEKPAFHAHFHDCEFDRVNFAGDWTDATFIRCDLSNSYPGARYEAGAVFEVHISHDSNITEMCTHNCQKLPIMMGVDEVWEPDPMFDKNGFEVDDGFETGSEAERAEKAEETKKAYAAYLKSDQHEKDQAAARERARVWRAELKRVAGEKARLARERAEREQAEQREAEAALAATLPQLIGAFVDPPVSHAGKSFRLRAQFSAPLSTGYADIRDSGFSVTGGRVTGARRVDRRSDLWELTIHPAGSETITLSGTDRLVDRVRRPVSAFGVTISGGG